MDTPYETVLVNCKLNNEYTLYFCSTKNASSLWIKDNTTFIAGFVDNTYSTQIGDGHTEVFQVLDNPKKWIIEICGDVSSVITIELK